MRFEVHYCSASDRDGRFVVGPLDSHPEAMRKAQEMQLSACFGWYEVRRVIDLAYLRERVDQAMAALNAARDGLGSYLVANAEFKPGDTVEVLLPGQVGGKEWRRAIVDRVEVVCDEVNYVVRLVRANGDVSNACKNAFDRVRRPAEAEGEGPNETVSGGEGGT